MSNVGRLIRAAREKQGYSVDHLAALVKRSPAHIHRIENSGIQGTPDTLKALGKVLGINERELKEAYVTNAAESAAIVWGRR